MVAGEDGEEMSGGHPLDSGAAPNLQVITHMHCTAEGENYCTLCGPGSTPVCTVYFSALYIIAKLAWSGPAYFLFLELSFWLIGKAKRDWVCGMCLILLHLFSFPYLPH